MTGFLAYFASLACESLRRRRTCRGERTRFGRRGDCRRRHVSDVAVNQSREAPPVEPPPALGWWDNHNPPSRGSLAARVIALRASRVGFPCVEQRVVPSRRWCDRVLGCCLVP